MRSSAAMKKKRREKHKVCTFSYTPLSSFSNALDFFSQFAYQGEGEGEGEVGVGLGEGKLEKKILENEIPIPEDRKRKRKRNAGAVEKVRIVSHYFQNSSKKPSLNNIRKDDDENHSQHSVQGKGKGKGRSVKTPKTKKNSKPKAKARATLSAKELFLEAYRRKSADDTWNPPPSETRLLQHDHVFDPWRVLIICILLNRTSGTQAKEVIPNFFSLCPNAEAVADVSCQQIQEIIGSLGLHRMRSKTIRRMSEMYLKDTWTHVTQLPGVGKYAADAHAILCTGYWDHVIPKDYMLNYYWDFLHTIKDEL